MRPSFAAGLVGLFATTSVGCSSPDWRNAVNLTATWSDDDSKLLVVIERYEVTDGDMATVGYEAAMRNLTREHRILNLNGETERDFGTRSGLDVWSQLMLGEGYIFSYVTLGGGTPHRNELWWLESGELIRFEDDEAPLLPSPDGKELARTRYLGERGSTEDDLPFRVEFIDVHNMEVRQSTNFTLVVDEAGFAVSSLWASNDELIVRGPSGAVAVSRATGETRPFEGQPTCAGFDANTASSPWAEDGRTVDATLDANDEIRIEILEADGPGWPERCLPDYEPEGGAE